MRRLVVVNEQGHIIATIPHPEDTQSKAGGPRYGFRPVSGQKVHSIDLPAELSDGPGLTRLHKSFRIEEASGGVKLVNR